MAELLTLAGLLVIAGKAVGVALKNYRPSGADLKMTKQLVYNLQHPHVETTEEKKARIEEEDAYNWKEG